MPDTCNTLAMCTIETPIDVIQRVSNNKFAPKDSMTREAAIKTAVVAAE